MASNIAPRLVTKKRIAGMKVIDELARASQQAQVLQTLYGLSDVARAGRVVHFAVAFNFTSSGFGVPTTIMNCASVNPSFLK